MSHSIKIDGKEYTLTFHKKFERVHKKLTKKDKKTRDLIDNAILTFLDNPNDEKLNLHQIHCKVDTTRLSFYIRDEKQQDTGLRIMLHTFMDYAEIFYIGSHDAYMRENKDC